MGRRFLLVKKLGRTYKRFSVRYAIPLFIATLSWNSFRGHVRNEWYTSNRKGVEITMEENFKETIKIGMRLSDFERNVEYYVRDHKCKYHTPIDEMCPEVGYMPNLIEDEVIPEITPNWIIWIQRTFFGLPIEYNVSVCDLDAIVEDEAC